MLYRRLHFSPRLIIIFLVMLASFLILLWLFFSAERRIADVDGKQIKLAELHSKKGNVRIQFFDGKEKNFSITAPRSFFLNYEGNLNFTQVFAYNNKKFRGKWDRYVTSPGYDIKISPEEDVIYELYAIPVWEVTTRTYIVHFVTTQGKHLKISILKKT